MLRFVWLLFLLDRMFTLLTVTPVDLHLILEKSIWKNQVQRTGFLVYFKLKSY